jgi:PAS domain-containing protein
LIQCAATLIDILFIQFFPSLLTRGLLEVLGVALTSFLFGTGPGILAIIVALGALDFALLPPYGSWSLSFANYISLFLFLCVGMIICLGTVALERARRVALQLAQLQSLQAERQKTILQTIPAIVALHDRTGAIVHLNERGKQAERACHPLPTLEERSTCAQHSLDDETLVPLMTQPLARALQGEVVMDMELAHRSSPTDAWVDLVSAAPLYDAQQRVEGAITVVQDVPTLRQAERDAAQRANELETLLETITDGILVVDRAGRITRINSAMNRLLGLERDAAYLAKSPVERLRQFSIRDTQGRQLSFEELPISRLLSNLCQCRRYNVV